MSTGTNGSAIRELLSAMPPVLQLLIVTGLGLITVVSWSARLFPSLHWLWSRPDAHTRFHFQKYTVGPTLAFATAVVALWRTWDPALPWHGSWAPLQVWGAVGTLFGAFGSLLTAHHLARRIDLSDARRLTSWIPLLLCLTGIGLVFAFVLIFVT